MKDLGELRTLSSLLDCLTGFSKSFLTRIKGEDFHGFKILKFFLPLPCVIFEINLNETNRVDVSFPFIRKSAEPFFALQADLKNIPRSILESTEWKPIIQFSELINSKKAGLRFHTVWLEFDEATSDNQIPVPGIFFNCPDDFSTDNIVIEAIEKLSQHVLSNNHCENIYRALSSSNFSSDKCDIGIFPSRQSNAIRISTILPIVDLFQSINLLGISLDYEFLKTVQKVQQYVESYRLNIDVHEDHFEVQSLELYACDTTDSKTANEKWNLVFKQFVNNKCYREEIIHDFFNWHENSLESSTHDAMVKFSMFPLVTQAQPDLFFRRINHIKVLHNSNRDLKVYLKESYRWHI